MKGRILCIGEQIANAGLGLHGDLIAVTALGGHGMTVPTFLSTSISPLHRKCVEINCDFAHQQINACLDHPGVDAIKVGAFNDLNMVRCIGDVLQNQCEDVRVVVNPVLTTEAGEYLLRVEDIEEYKRHIVRNCDVLVVNIRDAELMTGIDIINVVSMCDAARDLYKMGCKSVMVTGGLLSGDDLHDVLVTDKGEEVLSVKKNNIHRAESYRFGGGWVLATGIATSLGQGFDLKNSINRSRQYVDKAIGTSFNSDENFQSMNLAHTIHPFVHDDAENVYKIIPGSRFRSL